MTEACARHAEEHIRTVNWVALHRKFAERIDAMREQAREALDDPKYPPTDPGETAVAALGRFRQLNMEMTLCREVDNFLAYLTDLLALVFKLRPETLRSSETVPLEFVIQHESMDDLLEALAERRVERLSYSGISDLEKYLSERLGFDLFTADATRAEVLRLVEARNLVVHKRAIVDERYRRHSGDSDSIVGERLDLSGWAVDGVIVTLPRVVGEMDRRAAEKWVLPRPRSAKTLGQGGNKVTTGQAKLDPTLVQVGPTGPSGATGFLDATERHGRSGPRS